MSHFTCIVIGDDPEKQLAPYNEDIEVAPYEAVVPRDIVDRSGLHAKAYAEKYGYDVNADGDVVYESTYNPDAKWDWYTLGGRWKDYFLLKEGNDKYADQCALDDIDLDGMRDMAAEEAAKEYDEIMEAVRGIEVPSKTWEETISDTSDHKEIQKRRIEYHKHPWIAAIKEKIGILLLVEDPVARYRIPRETFLQRARENAIAPFAIVKDGKWYEKGKMGWFGCVTEEQSDEQWASEVSKLLNNLPGGTLVSLYDLHI